MEVSKDNAGGLDVLGISASQPSETISDFVWKRFSLRPGKM